MQRHQRFALTGLVWFLGAVLYASPAWAQSTAIPTAPDPETVRLHLGPVLARPTLALTNMGVDTNVFNVADAQNPQSDFTLTLTPQADLWMRIGRTWVSGSLKEDLVWYKEFANERAANSSTSLTWLVPLTRMTFALGTNWLSARDRPGYEIDARAQRREHSYNGIVEVRALSRTLVGARADHRRITFDQSAIFLGSSLHDELNRTQTTVAGTLRHELTPLTSLTLDVSRQQDRFDFNPLRDSNSTQVTVGVKFDADAIISGSAQFGFRRFTPLATDVPGYRGGTVAVNIDYVLAETTKFGFQSSRDVQYSFDINKPYYLLTTLGGSVTQQVLGPLDVEGRLSRQRMAYRIRDGVSLPLVDYVDRGLTYGGGVGYHLGIDVRLAFNLDRQRRTSAVDGRSYGGLRFGTAVTYGF